MEDLDGPSQKRLGLFPLIDCAQHTTQSTEVEGKHRVLAAESAPP